MPDLHLLARLGQPTCRGCLFQGFLEPAGRIAGESGEGDGRRPGACSVEARPAEAGDQQGEGRAARERVPHGWDPSKLSYGVASNSESMPPARLLIPAGKPLQQISTAQRVPATNSG